MSQLASLAFAIATATGDESMPQTENPNFRAENRVVPRPQNGSSTTGLSFRCFLSTLLGYSSGNIVK